MTPHLNKVNLLNNSLFNNSLLDNNDNIDPIHNKSGDEEAIKKDYNTNNSYIQKEFIIESAHVKHNYNSNLAQPKKLMPHNKTR